ncbi:MAG TPA: M28 family peptidase, partial [Vicinamibacterales bacterium]|nr:M28 family peptidase [Vicinamibacterales bacterium]
QRRQATGACRLPVMQPRADQAAVSRLRGDVDALAVGIGERHLWRPGALRAAADHIRNEFARAGYEPTAQRFEVRGIAVENLEAVASGTGTPLSTVVVGAHYDSVQGCPGANDNGTGVAAMLELSRRFAGRPRPREIRFVAFVNEEPPWFQTSSMGSVVYATEAQRHRRAISGMLSLETMGYYSDEPASQRYPAPLNLVLPPVGNFIGFVANGRSAALLRRCLKAFRARTSFPVRGAAVPASIPGVGWSDHWAFWQAGYRAVMVTDTAPFRYPWYHTAGDTPDRISFDRLGQVVDGLEHVVHVLAGGE